MLVANLYTLVYTGTITQQKFPIWDDLQTSRSTQTWVLWIFAIVDRVQKCYLQTNSGKSLMSFVHYQVSNAGQDVRAAKGNQRSKQEWNWVIFFYYSTSTFCRVRFFPSQPRWTVSVSGHSCSGHGRSTALIIVFILLTWECYVNFLCFAPVWDDHCQNLSCAKETENQTKQKIWGTNILYVTLYYNITQCWQHNIILKL